MRYHFLNKILSALPPAELDILSPSLEGLDLPQGFVLGRAGEPIDYVYFLECGIASCVAISPEGHRAEAGIYGREGVGQSTIVAGSRWHQLDTNIQMAGEGHRIAADAFFGMTARLPVTVQMLHRFTSALVARPPAHLEYLTCQPWS